MEIRKLEKSEWKNFERIFLDTFDSDLPEEGHATFYGVFEGDELKGFLLAEQMTLFGQIFMLDRTNPKYILSLVKHVNQEAGEKCVGTVASDPRYGRLFETLGMRHVEGGFYRRGG